jgi:hypothetical protein
VRVLRAIAINTATIKMHGVVHAKILMSSTNASRSRGNESVRRSQSKNDFFTLSQRGMRGTSMTINATTTAVLSAAMVLLRRRCRRSNSFRSV